jgi:phenylpropionate dioxygenase-like ring-hydroxylating dioxygenase large terminal subunit
MTLLAEIRTAEPGLLDDRSLARRIFDHIDRGTTDLAGSTWREPVRNYSSSDRFEAELALVLRRHPTPFCPSAAVVERGSFVAREAAATPLLVVRGHDGMVRGFRNVCRHRGTAVASGRGTAPSFVCPYHGWVYRLDGRLRHVPHQHGFPGLDRDSHGLVPVPTMERSGMVFVAQDSGESEAAPSLGWLPDLISADQMLLGCGEREIEANWKILVEGFLEGYHIRSTHPQTFFPFGYDNLNVVEHYGPNSRVVFPFRRIEKLRDLPEEEWRLDGTITSVHHLFPNVMAITLSHHTALVVLEPFGPARTRMVTYSMTNRGRTGSAAAEAARRDSDFGDAGIAEDIAVARAIQRGLHSGANQHFEFGRFEGAVSHFHRHLDAALAAAVTG